MLKLKKNNIENAAQWQEKNITMPKFDIDTMINKTAENPEWVHFGAGNIFRGFMAACHQQLLDEGKVETGIVVVETFDYEIIEKIYKKYDNLAVLVSVQSSGDFDMQMVASIAEGLVGDASAKDDWTRLLGIFQCSSLKMVSFTVTEKGYAIKDCFGEYINIIKKDIISGPESSVHLISKVAALIYKRYQAGKYPVALVSMDNCANNGEILRNALLTVSKEWHEKGFVDEAFIQYVSDEDIVSFPLTMIDKITPRPSEEVKKELDALGMVDTDILITQKGTYIAPFVNAEATQYFFIEDDFPNGRIPLDETDGIWFTDRDTVNKVETMKVTTCLNPLHTAIAIFGCLLDISLVSDAMNDEDINRLVRKIGYDEGLPVAPDPKIISPRAFLDEVLNKRFPNPFIPDETRRIATDTSLKMGIRYGETIKAYTKSQTHDIRELIGIPLVIAAWCRYLVGIDDSGNVMSLSPDPIKDELQDEFSSVQLGDKYVDLRSILSNEMIFGSDLYKVGLGEKIEKMFNEMIAEKGAVRKTLKRYLLGNNQAVQTYPFGLRKEG